MQRACIDIDALDRSIQKDVFSISRKGQFSNGILIQIETDSLVLLTGGTDRNFVVPFILPCGREQIFKPLAGPGPSNDAFGSAVATRWGILGVHWCTQLTVALLICVLINFVKVIEV
jgi:hypothetical protein